MLVFLSLLAALASTAPSRPAPLSALLESPMRHVRTSDRLVASYLKLGAQRSYTFAGLLTALESTDVCVYVEVSTDLPSRIDARLVVLPIAGPRRYLRIEIADPIGREPETEVALIAHELRHALEVAAAPEVHDDETLAALYRRIGRTTTSKDTFDTDDALKTGTIVRRELMA